MGFYHPVHVDHTGRHLQLISKRINRSYESPTPKGAFAAYAFQAEEPLVGCQGSCRVKDLSQALNALGEGENGGFLPITGKFLVKQNQNLFPPRQIYT